MLVGERNGSVGLSMPAEAETCLYHANRLRTGIFKVLVMGAYSAGKSSFINALMCSQTLPEANTPCTSILTFIQYGDTSSCELFYRADGRKETMKLDDFSIHTDTPTTTRPNIAKQAMCPALLPSATPSSKRRFHCCATVCR